MTPPPDPQPIRIVDIDMPIGSMTSFMIKWAIASIPAVLILALLVGQLDVAADRHRAASDR